MANAKYPLLAREGWVHTALSVASAGLVHYTLGWLWALPLWCFVLFTLQFFRDPARKVPAAPRDVLCPADGRIVSVGEAEDPYLNRPARRISIFMNAFNVHSNRSPTEGRVMERWYHPGKFLNAALDKAARENERNALWIQTDEGDDVVALAKQLERLGENPEDVFVRRQIVGVAKRLARDRYQLGVEHPLHALEPHACRLLRGGLDGEPHQASPAESDHDPPSARGRRGVRIEAIGEQPVERERQRDADQPLGVVLAAERRQPEIAPRAPAAPPLGLGAGVHAAGQVQRLDLIRAKLPGVDEVVSRVPPEGAGQVHMYEAAAMLWTARRASGRAVSRLPMDPEWDEAGIRVELVR